MCCDICIFRGLMMMEAMWVQVLGVAQAALLFGSIYAISWLSSYWWSHRRIFELGNKFPGPKTLPILGNAAHFACKTEDIFPKIADLMATYGTVEPFRVWFGWQLYIIVCKPADIQIVLNKALQKGDVYRFSEPWTGHGLFTAPVTTWRHNRKLLNPAFNIKVLETFVPVFQTQNRILVQKLRSAADTNVNIDIFEYISPATLDIICETAMGTKLNAQEDHTYTDLAKRSLKIESERMYNIFYYPDWIFYRTNNGIEFMKGIKYFRDLTNSVIRRKRCELRKITEQKQHFVNSDDTSSQNAKQSNELCNKTFNIVQDKPNDILEESVLDLAAKKYQSCVGSADRDNIDFHTKNHYSLCFHDLECKNVAYGSRQTTSATKDIFNKQSISCILKDVRQADKSPCSIGRLSDRDKREKKISNIKIQNGQSDKLESVSKVQKHIYSKNIEFDMQTLNNLKTRNKRSVQNGNTDAAILYTPLNRVQNIDDIKNSESTHDVSESNAQYFNSKEYIDKDTLSNTKSSDIYSHNASPNSKKNGTILADDSKDFIPSFRKQRAFLDLLIECTMQNNEHWTDQQLNDEVTTMMIAGNDTTATVASFTLLMLGIYKDVQDKVIAELYEIFGSSDRDAETSDLSGMEYLDHVIKETMRLFPVGPLIVRKCDEDILLEKYTIPAGASIGIGIYGLHRDPQIWPDPQRFDPDRFQRDAYAQRHQYAYIPFSAGPRNCIGMKYAKISLLMMLSTILRNYEISCDYELDKIKLQNDIILKPCDGYMIRLKTRKL